MQSGLMTNPSMQNGLNQASQFNPWGSNLFSDQNLTLPYFQQYNCVPFSNAHSQLIQTQRSPTDTPRFDVNAVSKSEDALNIKPWFNINENKPESKIPEIDGIDYYSMSLIYQDEAKGSGDGQKILPVSFDTVRSLRNVFRYGKILSNNTGYFFTSHQLPDGKIQLMNGKYIHMYETISQSPSFKEFLMHLPYMQAHPILEILLKTLTSEYWPRHQPHEIMPDGEFTATHCDRWVDKFREKTKEIHFTEKEVEWERNPIQQYKSTVSQFNSTIANIESPIEVLRVDLCLSDADAARRNPCKLIDSFETLLNACKRKSTALPLKGLIWHLEYLERKGFYFHCLFFIGKMEDTTNGDSLQVLSEYWKYTLLKGDGIACSTENEVSLLRQKGIGLHNFSNEPTRTMFTQEIIPMLTLVDNDLRLSIPKSLLNHTHLEHVDVKNSGCWFDKSAK